MFTSEDFKNLINIIIPSQTLTIQEISARIVNLLLALAGIIAVIVLIYLGIMYITTGGRPEQAEKARQGLISVIIGIAIIALSYILVRFINQLIVQIVQ